MLNANSPIVVAELGRNPLIAPTHNLEVAVSTIALGGGGADGVATHEATYDHSLLHAPGSDDQDLSGLVPFTVFDSTKDPTGFISPADITITGNLDRTVTLTGTLDYFWRGRAYTLTAPWISPAHAVGDGPHYLYSTDGTTFAWSTNIWAFDSLQVARHYKGRYFRECHSIMPWQVHYNLHSSPLGNTMRLSGGSAVEGTFALNTAGDAAVTPDFAQAVILDEDLPSTIPSVTMGQYAQLYFSGSRVDNTTISQAFPYRVGSTYPLINTPTSGVFADVETTGNKYFNVYQLLVPAAADSASQAIRMLFLQPQTTFTSLAAAQAESPFSLDVAGLGGFATELVLWSRLTYLTGASYTATGKVRLMSIMEVTSKLNVSGIGSAATTAENVIASASGNLSAGTVATQLVELDTEKVAKATDVSITNVPRLVHWVYGGSPDGGTTPNAITQVSIDALVALGIPTSNIRWLYLDEVTNTFIVQDITTATTIENITITCTGGSFVISGLDVAASIDNITIVNGDLLTFVIADLDVAATIENIVITEGSVIVPVTWDSAHKAASLTLSAGDTIVTAGGTAWASVLATLPQSTGLRYCEIDFNGQVNASRGGSIAVGRSTADVNNFPGADTNSVSYTPIDGKNYYNGTGVASGLGAFIGLVYTLTVAWEASTGKVWFGLNSTPNVAVTQMGTLTGTVSVMVGIAGLVGITATIKDHPSEWTYTPPAGYVSWGA